MGISLLFTAIPPLFLIVIFILLWKEKHRFASLTPFINGTAALMFARLIDVISENPSIFSAAFLVTNAAKLVTVSDLADVFGVMMLTIGFIRTIKYQREEEKRITNLETLLPICATCKKIRNPDNNWSTIEEYLEQSGAPPLTHSICPECTEKYLAALPKRPK